MSEWISVKDRLPGYGELVEIARFNNFGPDRKLIKCAGMRMSTDVIGEHWQIFEPLQSDGKKPCGGYPFGDIVFWADLLTLPEPPKEEI